MATGPVHTEAEIQPGPPSLKTWAFFFSSLSSCHSSGAAMMECEEEPLSSSGQTGAGAGRAGHASPTGIGSAVGILCSFYLGASRGSDQDDCTWITCKLAS